MKAYHLKTAIIIPARLGSTRLKEKMIQPIGNGKTLIQYVHDTILKIGMDVFVACAEDALCKHIEGFGGKVIRTPPLSEKTGTDRVAWAINQIDPKQEKYDYVINFQGDTVNVTTDFIPELIDILVHNNADMVTVVTPLPESRTFNREDCEAYVATSIPQGETMGRALYFSRNEIPGYRYGDKPSTQFFIHCGGIYAYNRKTLAAFSTWHIGALEAIEKLEQLRLLEHGKNVFVKVVDTILLDPNCPMEIDTEKDLRAIRAYFNSIPQ